MIAARDALGRKTKVLGVVAENEPSYALFFSKGSPVSTNSADTHNLSEGAGAAPLAALLKEKVRTGVCVLV